MNMLVKYTCVFLFFKLPDHRYSSRDFGQYSNVKVSRIPVEFFENAQESLGIMEDKMFIEHQYVSVIRSLYQFNKSPIEVEFYKVDNNGKPITRKIIGKKKKRILGHQPCILCIISWFTVVHLIQWWLKTDEMERILKLVCVDLCSGLSSVTDDLSELKQVT